MALLTSFFCSHTQSATPTFFVEFTKWKGGHLITLCFLFFLTHLLYISASCCVFQPAVVYIFFLEVGGFRWPLLLSDTVFLQLKTCFSGNKPKNWFQPVNGMRSTCLLLKIHNNFTSSFCFSFLFSAILQKKHFSASVWSAQHPITGWNIQQPAHRCNGFASFHFRFLPLW